MILPPSVLRLCVKTADRRIGLWLPLILLWPCVFIFALLLSPLALVGAIVLWPTGWGKPVLLAGPLLLRLIWAVRGLEIDVRQPSERVFISFR